MCDYYRRLLRKLPEQLGLHCYAVSTHPDELVLNPPKKILDPPMGSVQHTTLHTMQHSDATWWRSRSGQASTCERGCGRSFHVLVEELFHLLYDLLLLHTSLLQSLRLPLLVLQAANRLFQIFSRGGVSEVLFFSFVCLQKGKTQSYL